MNHLIIFMIQDTHLFALAFEELLVELRVDRLHSVLEKELAEERTPEGRKSEVLHIGAVIELREQLLDHLFLLL